MSSVEMYDIGKDEWVSGYGESMTVFGGFPVDEYYRDAVVMEMKNCGGIGSQWRELGDMWEEGEGRRLGRIVVIDGQGWDTPGIFILNMGDIFRLACFLGCLIIGKIN
ncbi:hypothetical protein AgCh_022927 [Apium graveolens]